MSGRYFKLFVLPESLYATGAPVVIAAGALLKDNQTGKVLAQLKIQNISDNTIKAATVKIEPLDTVGKPLGEAIAYQYLDLNVRRDADFGQKTPIVLPDATTRGFCVTVSEVIFTDNSTWAASSEPWEPLPAPVPPEQTLQDRELAKQYHLKYGGYLFQQEKDLWRCSCGAFNRQSEPCCHKCRREAATISSIDLDKLKEECNARIAEEERIAAVKQAAHNAARKKRRIAITAVIVSVIAVALFVFITTSARNSARAAAIYQNFLGATFEGSYEDLGDFISDYTNNTMSPYSIYWEDSEEASLVFSEDGTVYESSYYEKKPLAWPKSVPEPDGYSNSSDFTYQSFSVRVSFSGDVYLTLGHSSEYRVRTDENDVPQRIYEYSGVFGDFDLTRD